MRQSDYRIVSTDDDFVFLVDLNLGNLSVTNDAENVVEAVARKHGSKRIIYRDSQGDWSELVHDGERFVDFAPYSGEVPAT